MRIISSSAFLLLSFLLAPLFSQSGRMDEEAMETIRFIRLAETKKNLNFDEDTLLKLNAMLDTYEEKRFELMRQQLRVHHAIRQGFTEEAAVELLQELRRVRDAISANDTALWNDAEKLLKPHEALAFYQFYSEFQSDVRRRVRALQDERRLNNRKQNFRRKQ